MIDYEIGFDSDLNLVRVTVSGVWGPTDNVDLLEQTSALVMDKSARGILIDHRNLRLDITTTDLYEMGEALKEDPSTPVVSRMAILVNDPEQADYRFFTNVMLNRGVALKTFDADGEPEAIVWLTASS